MQPEEIIGHPQIIPICSVSSWPVNLNSLRFPGLKLKKPMSSLPNTHKLLSDSPFRFLIIGVGRSGTSLLTGLLDAHSQLEVGFEQHADECLRGKALEENHNTMFFDRASAFIENNIASARASAKPVWGNKITTEQLGGLNKHNIYNAPPIDVLDTFFNQMVPGLKIIYLLRDGRACIASKLKRTPQSLEQACNGWKYGVGIYEFLQTRPQTLLLRFENLVQDPVAILTRCCEFIGVPFEEAMLRGTMNEKIPPAYRRLGVESDRGQHFDKEHPCVTLIDAELRRCGYIE